MKYKIVNIIKEIKEDFLIHPEDKELFDKILNAKKIKDINELNLSNEKLAELYELIDKEKDFFLKFNKIKENIKDASPVIINNNNLFYI